MGITARPLWVFVNFKKDSNKSLQTKGRHRAGGNQKLKHFLARKALKDLPCAVRDVELPLRFTGYLPYFVTIAAP
jgi:hypothetical protein